jgi:two-component system, NtrC family, sensor kinase
VRAMPKGGSIQIRAWKRDQWTEIVVRDEGPGIDPEILGEVFKPHVSTKVSGGLGLHIVETVVHQSGGKVRAANVTGGRGAEFTITVPLDLH